MKEREGTTIEQLLTSRRLSILCGVIRMVFMDWIAKAEFYGILSDYAHLCGIPHDKVNAAVVRLHDVLAGEGLLKSKNSRRTQYFQLTPLAITRGAVARVPRMLKRYFENYDIGETISDLYDAAAKLAIQLREISHIPHRNVMEMRAIIDTGSRGRQKKRGTT